jgi:hypothetical protein
VTFSEDAFLSSVASFTSTNNLLGTSEKVKLELKPRVPNLDVSSCTNKSNIDVCTNDNDEIATSPIHPHIEEYTIVQD